jgi:hypothetical protein
MRCSSPPGVPEPAEGEGTPAVSRPSPPACRCRAPKAAGLSRPDPSRSRWHDSRRTEAFEKREGRMCCGMLLRVSCTYGTASSVGAATRAAPTRVDTSVPGAKNAIFA